MYRFMLYLVILIFSSSALAANFVANSFFNSTVEFNDQNSAPFSLSQQQGQVQVVAFVYTHCTSVCPIIVADLKRLDSMLPTALKNKVQYLLVSLDPENDSEKSMKIFLQEHEITSRRWHFVRGNNDDTRELALLFDVRYRQDAGEIAHSNMISVLDTRGVLVYQRKGTDSLQLVVTAISQALTNTH